MAEIDEIIKEYEADPDFQALSPERQAGIWANWFVDQVKSDEEFASYSDERKQNILVNFLKERGVFDQPVEEGLTYGEKWLHTPGEMLTRLTGGTFRTMGSLGDVLEYTGQRFTGMPEQIETSLQEMDPYHQRQVAKRADTYVNDIGLTQEEAFKRAHKEVLGDIGRDRKALKEKVYEPVGRNVLVPQGKIIGDFWHDLAERFPMAEDLRGKNVIDDPEILVDPRYFFGGIADMVPSLLATLTPAGAARKLALKLTPKLATLVAGLGYVGTAG
jgi:hypothetical protein